MNENQTPSKPINLPNKIRVNRLTKTVLEAGGNMAKAARKLGVTRQTVQHHMKKPETQELMQQLCDAAGLTDKKLIKLLGEGCHAQKTQFFQHQGQVMGHEDVIDYPTRHEYIKTVLQLKGHLKTGGDVNVDASKKTVQLFTDLKEETVDSLETAGLINEINGRLSRQRT